MRGAVLAVAGIVLGVAGGLAVLAHLQSPGGVATAPASLEEIAARGAVPPFALVERSGRQVTREDLRGLVWVVDFIYTTCPDTCPLQSAELARLQREFAGEPDVRLVSISVDPEHDTPAVLRTYAARYGASDRWWFLTGDRRAIHCLALYGFRLGVVEPGGPPAPDCGPTARRLGPGTAWAHDAPHDAPPRPIMHSPRAALVDRAGQIRAYHVTTDPTSAERLRANLRRLLLERPDA